MGLSSGYVAWKTSFELSPIILTDGAASFIPGGMLPIISLTEALNFDLGILSGSSDLSLDDFFANYVVIPGGTLIDNQVATYTFANQATAANSIISNGRKISLRMICPAKGDGGYANKLATMIALTATLQAHINAGGLFTVATPAFFYTKCILTRLSDSTAQTRQPQAEFQWDFYQPLLSQQDAQQSFNALMGKLNSGTMPSADPAWSGTDITTGQTNTLATPSLVPASTSSSGSNIGFPNFQPSDI